MLPICSVRGLCSMAVNRLQAMGRDLPDNLQIELGVEIGLLGRPDNSRRGARTSDVRH